MDKPYDLKCDIWSIGCIIYEMCALIPPFRGTSLPNLCNNIKRGVYPPIRGYSSDLSKVISMMLQVRASNRPNCDELLKHSIIQSRMKELPKTEENVNDQKFELIKTIKPPRNLKNINGMLPERRYAKKASQEEMMMNDEFETKKAFFKDANKNELKNKDNNNVEYYDYKKKSNNNEVNSINKEPEAQQKKMLRANDYVPEQDNKKVIQHRPIVASNRPQSGVNKKPQSVIIKKPINDHSNNNHNKVNLQKSPVNSNNRVPVHKVSKPQVRPVSGKAPSRPNNIIQSKQPVSNVKKKVIVQKMNYNNNINNKRPSAPPQSAVVRRPQNNAYIPYKPKIGKK